MGKHSKKPSNSSEDFNSTPNGDAVKRGLHTNGNSYDPYAVASGRYWQVDNPSGRRRGRKPRSWTERHKDDVESYYRKNNEMRARFGYPQQAGDSDYQDDIEEQVVSDPVEEEEPPERLGKHTKSSAALTVDGADADRFEPEEQEESAEEEVAASEVAAAVAMPEVSGGGSVFESVSGASGYRREEAARSYQAKRRKRVRRKILRLVLICLCTMMLAVAAAAYAYIHFLNSELTGGLDSAFRASLADESAAAGDPFYALLIGADKNEHRATENPTYAGNNFRSDSMILARIDPKRKQVTLVSMHRDSLVDLSAYGGTGTDKLNSAFNYGGEELAVRTVENLTGVKISHYAEVDMDGFFAIDEALGGVEVTVPQSFWDTEVHNGVASGKQRLDGKHALVFCRARYAYNDVGDGDRYRARNQRIFISALAKRVLSGNLFDMVNTLNTMVGSVTTDMSLSDITSVASALHGMDTSTIYSCMCPTSNEMINGASMEIIDEEGFAEIMKKVDAGKDPNKVDEENGTKESEEADEEDEESNGGSVDEDDDEEAEESDSKDSEEADGSGSSSKSSEGDAEQSSEITEHTDTDAKAEENLGDNNRPAEYVMVRSGGSGDAAMLVEECKSQGFASRVSNMTSDGEGVVIWNEASGNEETARRIAEMAGLEEAKANDDKYSFTGDYLVLM